MWNRNDEKERFAALPGVELHGWRSFFASWLADLPGWRSFFASWLADLYGGAAFLRRGWLICMVAQLFCVVVGELAPKLCNS